MAGPTITAKFIADTKGLTKGVDTATQQSGSKMKSFATGAAAAIGGAFAIGAVVDFGKQAIDAASNVSESISKIGVVFGDAGDGIVKWSQDAATSMGMSQEAALAAAGTYGNLAVSLGLPQEQAASMSTSLVELASDMASFNNVPVEDALQALQSGLTGETEPLKKFGVNLNEAALKAEAMAMGLHKGKGPLSASAKAQASYGLIMKQTTTAQGDFARTSDGLANKNKINAAKFEDMKAKLGAVLLPAMTAVASFITDKLLPAFESIGNWVSDNQTLLASLGIGLAAVATVIGVTLIPAFIAWAGAAAAAAVATFAAAAPFLLIGAAVAAVAFVIIKNWDTIVAALKAAFEWIKNAINAVWQAIQTAWDAILNASKKVWKMVTDAVKGAFNWIKTNWPLVLAIITGPIGLAVLAVTRNWDKIKSGFRAVWSFIKSTAGTIFDILKWPFQKAADFAKMMWDRIIASARGLKNTLVNIFSTVGNAITAPIKAVWNALASTWNSTVGRISISIPSWVPKVGGKGFNMPDLPRLAKGGIVSSPTVALIGERGPEAVVPLDRYRGSGGDVTNTININVTAGVGDPAEIGREIINAIRSAERVQGTSWRVA